MIAGNTADPVAEKCGWCGEVYTGEQVCAMIATQERDAAENGRDIYEIDCPICGQVLLDSGDYFYGE